MAADERRNIGDLADSAFEQAATNLLQEMRREGILAVEGSTRWAKWR